MTETVRELTERAVERLIERGDTIAVAESLTGGLLADAFVVVPGTSATFRGAVVAYATELKHDLLDVPSGLLDERGPVDGDVALAMAGGVRARLGADWGLSTTGVAGPEPQDGEPPGRVFVAVSGPSGERVAKLDLPGGRAEVRAGTVAEVLRLLLAELDSPGSPEGSAEGSAGGSPTADAGAGVEHQGAGGR